MVKIEDHDQDDSNAINPQPAMVHASVKEEEGQPSSSSCYLRSQFIGMGFSPMLVDKVLQKHGDHDSETILEYLLSHSAPQKSGSESSSSLGSLFDSVGEENTSHLESWKERVEDIKPELDVLSEKKSRLCSIMNFSQQEVDFAFKQLGEEASLEELVECILTSQVAGFSGGNENGDASNEGHAESLFTVMDKTLRLLQMGFTEEEISSVIDTFGQEATVLELADSIFASRLASSIEQKEVKVEPELENEFSTSNHSYSGLRYYDDVDDDTRVKRAKHIFIDDSGGSSSTANQPSLSPWFRGHCDGSVKEEFDTMTPGRRANVRGDIANPPYFLYGNVVDIPKATWSQLSQFLYNVEPEFVNSQSFSALMRKEGYIHNLPTERRRVALPKPPMTIQDALPVTRRWWPSWDTRKHFAGVTEETEVAELEQMCEKLGKMTRDSRGVLSPEKQMQIAKANLIWVGPGKLSPLEPHQYERILGYPDKHTDCFGMGTRDRIAAMKYEFQTDTLSYFLSALKDIYPDGIRVLSIYTGIGGAEITLHRLNIPLKCVVSIEESDVNRRILRRWWRKTEQRGELRQVDSICKVTTTVLGDFIKEFGAFDLVVGGNRTTCRFGSTVNASMGMNANMFHEFVRVITRVRQIIRRC